MKESNKDKHLNQTQSSEKRFRQKQARIVLSCILVLIIIISSIPISLSAETFEIMGITPPAVWFNENNVYISVGE